MLHGIDDRIAEEVDQIKVLEHNQENVIPRIYEIRMTIVAVKDRGVYESCWKGTFNSQSSLYGGLDIYFAVCN